MFLWSGVRAWSDLDPDARAAGVACERGLSAVALWSPGPRSPRVLAFVALAGCAAHAALPSYSTVPRFHSDRSNRSGVPERGKVQELSLDRGFYLHHLSRPLPADELADAPGGRCAGRTLGVKLVSFTVDPQHDTPPVLAEYAQHFGAKPGVWFFLTGPVDDAASSEPRRVHAGQCRRDAGAFDALRPDRPRGAVRGYYQSSDEDAVPRLIADARSWLKTGTDHSVPARSAWIVGSTIAVDRAVLVRN